VSSASIPTIPVFSDFNTGINTAQICGGIPVFGIPGYRYWRPYVQVQAVLTVQVQVC